MYSFNIEQLHIYFVVIAQNILRHLAILLHTFRCNI